MRSAVRAINTGGVWYTKEFLLSMNLMRRSPLLL